VKAQIKKLNNLVTGGLKQKWEGAN